MCVLIASFEPLVMYVAESFRSANALPFPSRHLAPPGTIWWHPVAPCITLRERIHHLVSCPCNASYAGTVVFGGGRGYHGYLRASGLLDGLLPLARCSSGGATLAILPAPRVYFDARMVFKDINHATRCVVRGLSFHCRYVSQGYIHKSVDPISASSTSR